jgi:drug/metabolite transporter (DMT)-like permease
MKLAAAILYVGVFPSLVAYALFNRSVTLIGSVRAGAYMNLPPVLGVGLAMLLLGEGIASYHFIGALLIIGAIAVSRGYRPRANA